MLADQIVRNLDHRIGKIAEKLGLNYTRYVDDITISGNFPLDNLASQIRSIIFKEGFHAKKQKTIVYSHGDKQERIITGVRIKKDGSVSAPLDYFTNLRETLAEAAKQSRVGRVDRAFDRKNQYLGRICHVLWLDPNMGIQLMKLYRKVKWKRLERAQSLMM